MAGRPAYDRETYAEDITTLRARGASVADICRALGISRATYFRIIAAAQGGRR